MAAAARAFFLYHVTDPSLKALHDSDPSPPFLSRHFIARPLVPSSSFSAVGIRRSAASSATVSCLSGGVSDDFVSTRKFGFDRGFSVIANMLKRIEPLDTTVISKGVSDSAKDSMKQTISSMLGLLPSDQFSVTVRVSKRPLDSLLVSSIMTGYTLWNAEYRISLMRNFDITIENSKRSDRLEKHDNSELQSGECETGDCEVGVDMSSEEFERTSPESFVNMSPEALNYIQLLQSELSTVKEELDAQKQENVQLVYGGRNRNDLLEYLRSLDADMVMELSQPSSLEVENIIHQLAHSVLQRFFKDDVTSDFMGDLVMDNAEDHQDDTDKLCDTIGASRDYLAKLLFWCMLLGHHLRGLENRLQLSCAVGLL